MAKNILLISHDFSVTGAPNSLLRQAKYFTEAKHNVDVWTLGGGGLQERYQEAGFAPVYIKNNRKYIKKYFESIDKKYDLIVCNTTVTYKCVDVLHRYNIPLIWFIRETKLVDEEMLSNKKFAEIFKSFYNLYTVSDYAAGVVKKYNSNVRIINNSIEDTFTCFSKVNSKIKFGYIGSIIPVKGVDVLLDAFSMIANKDEVELIIAGCYNRSYGQNLFNKYKEETSIKWLSEVQKEKKDSFFSEIDVLCVPSLDDPCPLTVIEGAMHGKALIVTKNTGSNFVVKEGSNGYIVTTNSVQDFLSAMQKINIKNISSMQKKSREMYLEYGSTQREKKEVLNMLENNLSNIPIITTKLSLEKKRHTFYRFLIKFVFIKKIKRLMKDKLIKMDI